MEPLKDQFFNPTFYNHLAEIIKEEYSGFNKKEFLKSFENHQELELLDRMKQVSDAIFNFTKGDYKEKLTVVQNIAPKIKGFAGMAFPYFVEKYGVDHYDLSIQALKYLTQFSSSEFAIRVFLKSDLEKTLTEMENWALDENEHVRRLASEGSRPILPWSFKLHDIIKNPRLTQKILATLNNDSSLYVRKSVGNHLNDITKFDPEYVFELINTWDLKEKHTLWIITKGVRTLIKKGDSSALNLLGYNQEAKYSVELFYIKNHTVSDTIPLTINSKIISLVDQKLNIDLVLYYLKSNRTHTEKVFKLKSLNVSLNEVIKFQKEIKFHDLSTRKHHKGEHFAALIINGQLSDKIRFELV